MVVIRLARGGAKKRPFFNIVVADSRMRRDGRFIERWASTTRSPRAASSRCASPRPHRPLDGPGRPALADRRAPGRAGDEGRAGLSLAHGSRRTAAAAARPTPAWPDDAIEVGRIVDAWGIKGWFKVQPYCRRPAGAVLVHALVPAAARRTAPRRPRARRVRRCCAITRGASEHGDCVVAQRRRTSPTATRPRRCAARASSSPRSSFPTAAARRVLLGRPDRPGGRQPRGLRSAASPACSPPARTTVLRVADGTTARPSEAPDPVRRRLCRRA